MAMLPFRPAPFFDNKNAAFWNLQFAGWGGVFVLRSTSAIANQQPWDLLLVVLVQIITGFAISLVLSVIYGQLIKKSAFVTWSTTALVLATAVAVYAAIDAWLQGIYYSGIRETTFVQRMLALAYLDGTLLGAWSALYYAINFFLQVEEQADRLERLEAQATSAQLAMLRYQLNPHFLFNTLNSISTLVLLKQTEPANAMLTRLSAFLRHTLVSEPGSKVTVAQEVETLQLYLGIERMRFEERLRTEFHVEPEAANACLPSMLLQPLVENAIKYAVSPQEEGACITLSAQLVGRRLRIAVSDTGPGLRDNAARASVPSALAGVGRTVSTGVGLANIRDRLQQAYGEDHRFEIRNPPEGGFTVIIEIPHEAAERQAPPAQAKPPAADVVIAPRPEPRSIGNAA
ncbi:Sensor histidine kinase YpdA [Tsuneonella dongtanensis]|uniref:Sensor histidine kinase YpdA n=1 Tax=Tsuneonella dongtanensis TaxID=692370 RepID=A0A1B2AA77_9SPHN|nr:histidine kinase [Tsuneonella dongtanensis]ANY19083.1 Sensor histidine kinase YpdA [Tsuneonella dongtanensis]